MNLPSSFVPSMKVLALSCMLFSLQNSVIAQTPDSARSNSVAFAFPTQEITIDGDVSDWPDGLPEYSIEDTPYGNAPQDEEDFKASFQVAYNAELQQVYVAVTVVDDEQVIDVSEESAWNTQDIHNFYLDPNYDPKGSGMVLYSFNSQLKEIADPSTSWDPSVRDTDWSNIKVATKTMGSTTVYEWGIDIGDHCKPMKTIGMDHVMIDQDADEPNSFVSWNEGGGKSQFFGRLGQVILMPDQSVKTGIVDGYLKWRIDTTTRSTPKRIVISSKEHPELWVLAKINDNGYYAQELPEGSYNIRLFWGYDDDIRTDPKRDKSRATIKGNRTTRASDLMVSNLPKPELEFDDAWIKSKSASTKEVDDFVTTYMSHFDIPGVSLALIKGNEVAYHQTYGVENTFTDEAVDKTTLFEAASITKPVFAYAVCRLAERGEIDLDQPLHTYLPFEAIAHDERYKKITARHVLSHRTGFPNWAWMNDDGVLDIKFEPGTDYGYSGEGFEYLKRVVVEITGKTILEILDDETLSPLGLDNIYFMHDPQLAKVVAHGHWDFQPARANLPSEPGVAWSMHTEAREFAKFLVGIKNRVGLTPNTYASFFEKITEADTDPDRPEIKNYFGLGMWFADTPVGRVFGHGGNNGDFKCQALYFEDLEFGLTIFTNSNTGDSLISDLIDFLVYGKNDQEADMSGE